jgi:hypothetical protein
VAGKLQNEEALQLYRGLVMSCVGGVGIEIPGSANQPSRNDALPSRERSSHSLEVPPRFFLAEHNNTSSGQTCEAVKLVGHETVGSAGRKHLRSYKFSQ